MASAHRSTGKSSRRVSRSISTKKSSNRLFDAMVNAMASVVPAQFEDPALNLLNRSQRLRMGDLARVTGVSPRAWIERAVENFLQTEGAVRMMR